MGTSTVTQQANGITSIVPDPAPYFIHRSGTETLWTCPRKYFWEYLYDGTGIRRSPTKIQLTVGSAVHAGLAFLLAWAMQRGDYALSAECCTDAIAAAVDYFEASDTFQHMKVIEQCEQETLIAGLLWSWFYYAWPVFVRTYEVLSVERAHVEVLLYHELDGSIPDFHVSSRPDAIVRHRLTNEFIGISWKTIDDLAEYKRWNFRENLQNLMETSHGEKVLSEILDDEFVFTPEITQLRGRALIQATERAIADFRALPREISYVQTIFLVKGPRVVELLDGTVVTFEEGLEYEEQEKTWRQQSFLCYRYVNAGVAIAEDPDAPTKKKGGRKAATLTAETSWSYRYWKEGNKSYNNLGGDWVRQPVWDSGVPVQEWVHVLNAGMVFPSGSGDTRNLDNPLSKVVVFDHPVERNAELMTETMNQVETLHYETVRAGLVAGVFDISMFRRNLNACNNSAPSAGVPVRCEFRGSPCYESVPLIQIGAAVDSKGGWVRRVPHHEVERASFEARGLLAPP